MSRACSFLVGDQSHSTDSRNQHAQIDGPSKGAWTLPYLVTVNEEYPFGMYVSHPSYFPGQFSNDGRLKWYATSSNKDLIMTAKVSKPIDSRAPPNQRLRFLARVSPTWGNAPAACLYLRSVFARRVFSLPILNDTFRNPAEPSC